MSREDAERIQKEAEQNGKADFSLELEIKDADGEVAALIDGIWQIRQISGGI